MTSTENLLTSDAIRQLFTEARIANAFTDEPVTDEEVQAIFDVVKWAPTAMNMQAMRVLAIRSQDQRAKLVEAMMAGNKPKTLAAPLTLVFAADLDFHRHLGEQFPAVPGAVEMFEDMGREGRDGTAPMNAALQIAYWIIGVRAAELAIGPMTGFDAAAVDAAFFPDGQHTALVIANVGHPDESATYPRGPRLDIDQVVTTL